MSMFLGPIHFMMFGKIQTAADRSRAVVDAFRLKYPADTDAVVKAALPDGLIDLSDKQLDNILGDNPIHGFLQGLIDEVETAEASLATALLYRFPDDGEAILKKAFFDHGSAVARRELADSGSGGNPQALFQRIIGGHYLEGMPCDQVSSYRMTGNTLEISHSDCLHRPKWESAGAPVAVMCELMDQWVLGCARAISPGITLTRQASIIGGANECRCTVAFPAA